MGEMDNFNINPPDKCPRCGKDIVTTPEGLHYCPGCGCLYYDDHLGIWRIKVISIE